MVIYNWSTHKKEKGFEYKVKQIIPKDKPTKKGYYATTKTIKTGKFPTRARAKAQAQRWTRYYNNKIK